MKKILVIALISSFFSASAFAAACSNPSTGGAQSAGSGTTQIAAGEQCVCNGVAAVKSTVNGGSGTVVTLPLFVRNGFDVQCSANTIVSYSEESVTGFAVAGGSAKGNQTVQGASNGGAVTTSGKCPTSGCTAGEVTTALTAAKAIANGS
jgi:hypothetical protein